jgi:hypothetical protein
MACLPDAAAHPAGAFSMTFQKNAGTAGIFTSKSVTKQPTQSP